ncbi:MAG: ankyrin repeat domain-containing protein, partial [Candidatus Babeliales bacterium]
GDTPLHGASEYGSLEVVKLLLEKGAPIDIQDNFGDTPLHLASRKGHLEVVKLLLEKRAQIDIKNKNGWTPLRLASFKGKLKAVKLLEEAKKRKKVTQDQYNAIKVLTSNKTGNELWQCNYMQAPSIDQPREKSIIDTNIDTDPDRDISNEEKQENFSTHEKPKSSILHNYNPFKWKYAFGLPLLSIGYWAYKHFITKCH